MGLTINKRFIYGHGQKRCVTLVVCNPTRQKLYPIALDIDMANKTIVFKFWILFYRTLLLLL